MYVTRTKLHINNFYLDDAKDKADFEKLLNDPAINVIEKKYYTESTTSYEGESSETIQRPCARLEYEICSL
jgi:hypothetical protein